MDSPESKAICTACETDHSSQVGSPGTPCFRRIQLKSNSLVACVKYLPSVARAERPSGVAFIQVTSRVTTATPAEPPNPLMKALR
ncbi:hypothetical protein OGAPHI_004451 [Ogataea philodendri]|uniref:Uncharacterized protein n=1 Tax=Ogataea philodendri TaxID=1378263 RepID=A0A9P8P6L7_9ASCO|nr:uncharacterized protein OGAPHI_004451 [Ogataea philodendri]KAH3666262.1 hypothetical protein OGAPHI_004451 [Ogataea philodendri]